MRSRRGDVATTAAGRRRGPTDHGRRDRIAKAAWRVMSATGMAGLTHRAVADEAGVPLGSTTYYFADRDALIVAALRTAIDAERGLVARYLEFGAGTLSERLASLLSAQTANRRARDRFRAAFELYVVAARSDSLRPVSAQWDAALRSAIADRCDNDTARNLYAAMNGLALEAIVADRRVDAKRAAGLFQRIEQRRV